MYQNIFDSHGHYNGKDFPDRDELLPKLFQNGISGIIDVASSMRSTRRTVELSARYDRIYSAIGVHPNEVKDLTDADYDTLRELSKLDKVVSIGEIGLDYYWDASERDVQREHFERQLILANELDLPVIIHSRDAAQETLDLLQKYRPKGVVHCFSYSAEVAQEILKIGMYIGFTGVVTFKNAKKAVKAASVVPMDRLLIETDCPYMAPEPTRGVRCDSSMLVHTGGKLAEITGIELQELFDQTHKTACELFGIHL